MIKYNLLPNIKFNIKKLPAAIICLVFFVGTEAAAQSKLQGTNSTNRERISINKGWRFYRYNDAEKPDTLIYDVRPDARGNIDERAADAKPTEAVKVEASSGVLKPYILPTGNAFIKDRAKRYIRPTGNPGDNFPFVKSDFDDSKWESVELPHDWAIKGPFYKGQRTPVGGSMGRLPVQGVAWYRRKLEIPAADAGKSIFLDVDGAMSYAMVWLNGKLVGGWPYGYNSWRVDLTPYIVPGGKNQLAIRLDNPVNSSRWYPGGGIYRNVWLVKTNPVHVSQWGTFCQTSAVSNKSAKVNLRTIIDNDSKTGGSFSIKTDFYLLNAAGNKVGQSVVKTGLKNVMIRSNSSDTVNEDVIIANPKLWQPLPDINHNLYAAVTTLFAKGKPMDTYETHFGIRDVRFDPEKGILVNGKQVFATAAESRGIFSADN